MSGTFWGLACLGPPLIMPMVSLHAYKLVLHFDCLSQKFLSEVLSLNHGLIKRKFLTVGVLRHYESFALEIADCVNKRRPFIVTH